jgi:hypothetical protein
MFPALRLRLRQFVSFALIGVFVCLSAACAAQASKTSQTPGQEWVQNLTKNPELLAEFGQLFQKLQSDVHFPPARSESSLLPLLPESTVFYAALPNYGDAAQQALAIFHSELQHSAALRNWWHHGEMASTGPTIEDALETFYRLSQYLGDEMVISASIDRSAPSLLLVAPVSKPGLRLALQQMLDDLAAKSKSKPGILILDRHELATAQDTNNGQDAVVLVRPDYLVAAANVATLRRFNSRLDAHRRDFLSTGFGQRVERAYQDGVTAVGALDLQTTLSQALSDKKQDLATLQRTGFADVQYMVWEHTKVAGKDVSQSELSFIGPRRGIASWLGAPSHLGSLDFASPKAIMAVSLVLANPAHMFEDIRELATATNPNAFASITQAEQQLKISVQDDLLRLLGGELTFEIDSVTPPAPAWKAILQVNDPIRLQQTLTTLLASEQLRPEQFEGPGATYYKVRIPSGQSATEIAYAFVDGYLVVASSPDTVKEAVRLHLSGESLAKSRKFLASLPPGHLSGVSALLYQDPIAMTALRMQQIAPEIAGPLAQLSGQSATPAVMAAYGSENAIQGASTSATMDVGMVLVGAAIAIPNLLRSRIAANEASAVGTLRTLNVAQVTYAATYPERGFAPDLATLGPGPGGPSDNSADHAGLIADPPGCSASAWCEKSGFRFRITPVCLRQQCPQYAVVATPINANTGSRNFCSNSDGVIRFQVSPPLTSIVRSTECRSWQPLR